MNTDRERPGMPGNPTPLTAGEAKLVLIWLAVSVALAACAIALVAKTVVNLIWS